MRLCSDRLCINEWTNKLAHRRTRRAAVAASEDWLATICERYCAPTGLPEQPRTGKDFFFQVCFAFGCALLVFDLTKPWESPAISRIP